MQKFSVISSLLFAVLLWGSASAQVLNDGTQTNNLTQISNVEGKDGASAFMTLEPGGVLRARQAGQAFFALRNVWYANDVSITNPNYTVSAEFLPFPPANPRNRGGVMGWLDVTRQTGIGFKVRPQNSFEVSFVDFTAMEAETNESVLHLYNLDGSPATEDVNSAWSSLGAYTPTNYATFELAFTEPTPAERQALSNATARVTARVFQRSGGETNPPAQIGRTIELLTDLPVPLAQNHSAGYFGYWGSTVASGREIGDFDNLTATGGVVFVPNTLPSVTLLRPTNNATFPAGSAIDVEAQATDPDGTITRVDFLAGTNLLSSSIGSNNIFRGVFTNLSAGSYSVSARAYDNRGGGSTSTVSMVTIETGGSSGDAVLTIRLTETNTVVITWTETGYTLQSTDNLLTPTWGPVAGTMPNRAEVPATGTMRFFRLAR